MTLEKYLEPTSIMGWVALFAVGGFWFGGTVCVLCIMEVGICLTTKRIEAELCINRAYQHSYMPSDYTG